MSSPAAIIATSLANDVTIGSLGWVFRVSQELNLPDKYVTLFDYAGENRLITLGDGSDDILKPAVQIRVRGAVNGYADAYAFCETIQSYMRSFEYIGGTDKMAFASQTGGINNLPYDDLNRPIFTLNFTFYKCTV